MSNEGDAVRAARRAEVREASERSKRIAEASALALALEEEKVALQSEVTPEAKRSKRSKRSMKRSNERSKRIAEASALALALEEEEIVLPEEQLLASRLVQLKLKLALARKRR